MEKRKGRLPRVAKLTDAHGTLVVDIESGLLVRVSHDVETEPRRPATPWPSDARHRAGSPNPKLSRN